MGKTGIAAVILLLFSIGITAEISKSKKQETNRASKVVKDYVWRPTPKPKSQVITMAVVGDIMLSRSVDEQMKKRGDWTWPFASTAAELKEADITLGNLETPVLETCPPMTNRMVFCAEDESVAGLVVAGFDAVSLANNHTLNQGRAGLTETERLVEGKGIKGVREGETEIIERGGIRLGIIAFDDVSKLVITEDLRQQIATAAAMTDIVVVIPHWGSEYVASPSARQVTLAHKMVEAGADVVVGAHPHWTQTTEVYRDKVIIYSLGNFVFDQMWSEETRRGSVADIRFKIIDSRLEVIEFNLLPIKIFEYGQARWVN